VWHHLGMSHGGGQSVDVQVKFPKHKTFAGFPTGYSVFVTPDQPAAVSVTNRNSSGFSITLTSLSDTPLAAGAFMAMVVG
jgi:hypothetical protein